MSQILREEDGKPFDSDSTERHYPRIIYEWPHQSFFNYTLTNGRKWFPGGDVCASKRSVKLKNMVSKTNILSLSGIAIIWLLWFIFFLILDLLMNGYVMGIFIFTILILIALTPLFFGILLNLLRGIVIGFLGTLIPAIVFLDSHIGIPLFFLVVMIFSMSSSLLLLINSNRREKELIILGREYTKMKNFYINLVHWMRKHPILTTLIVSLVGSLIASMIYNLIQG